MDDFAVVEQHIAALSDQLEASLERERLFREDFSRRLSQELRDYIDHRLRHWISSRGCIALPEGAKIFTHTTDGHRILLDPTEPFISFHVMEHGNWEEPVRKVLSNLLRDGEHYIDVGANIGLHVLYASSLVGKSGKIIALEPHPTTAAILRQNLEINGLLDRVHIFQMAASSTHEEIRIFEYFPQHSAMSGFSLAKQRIEQFRGTPIRVEVNTVRIDRITMHEQTAHTVIKIDVEGFEKDVINGAGYLLDNPNTSMIIEFDAALMDMVLGDETAKNLFLYLVDRGFSAFGISEEGLYQVTNLESIIDNDVLFTKPESEHYQRVQPIVRR